MKVTFTPAAEPQFLNAVAYVLAERPNAARRFHARATKRLKRLERFPNSGRRIPEFPELPHREVVIRRIGSSTACKAEGSGSSACGMELKSRPSGDDDVHR